MFWEHYIGAAHGCATDAARMAGYTGTDEGIRRAACDNMKNPLIRARIDEFLSVHAMSAAEVLAELTAVAKLPAAGDPRQVKNKVTALATLAKYHGLLVDKIKLDIDVTKLSDEELEQYRASFGGRG